MSRAFKCNRCFKCFDPREIDAVSYFTTIPEYYTQSAKDYISNKVMSRKEDQHLCSDCARDFMAFMMMDEEVRKKYNLPSEKE